MKHILALGIGALLVLAGCSTNRHLVAPDPAANQVISPEAGADECSPCEDESGPYWDTICGDLNSSPACLWRFRHKRVE